MAIEKSLTEQATILFAGNVLAMFVGLVVPIILVRIFPRSEYGLYQQLFLIFTTMLPFGQMGVTQGLYYFFPREPENRDAVIMQTYLFVVATGLLFLLLLIFFRHDIASFMNNARLSAYIPYLAIFIMMMIISSFLETLMIAEKKTYLASSVRVISQIVRASTIITAALISRNIMTIFKALCLFAFARCLYQWIYLRHNYHFSLKVTDRSFWRRQFSYSLPIGVANIAWILQTKLHSFMVSFLFTPAQFAIYAVGTYNLPFIGMITSSVSNVMIPEFSKCQKEGNITRILSVWSGAMRKMNIFIIPVFVFFFVMAYEFIQTFFSVKYIESVNIFRICLLGILVSSINTGAVLNAYAQTRYLMKLAFFRIPVAIGILYLFAKTWGIEGAITADVIITFSFRMIVLKKVAAVMKTSMIRLLMLPTNLKIMVAASTAAIPVLFMKYLFISNPSIILFLSLPVFTIIYLILGARFGILTKYELGTIRRRITSKPW